MESQAKTLTKREKWPDIARGLCAMFVILSHISNVPIIYGIFYAPFMVPIFFIVSGYLTKNYGGKISDFLYNKVLKEIILKLMVVISLTTLSVSTIAGFFISPSTILDWLWDTLNMMLLKPRALFFSMLVLCSVYFMIINKLCRNKPLPMLIVGTVTAAIGITVSHPGIIRLWAWDTALVCELFYIIGYCARQKSWISGFKFKTWHGWVSAIVFFTSVAVCAGIFGVQNVFIIVTNNTWAFIPTTILFIITGNWFIICLSNLMPENLRLSRLIIYIGRHSLIFFMFGGPIMAYIRYFVDLLYNATHWQVLKNNYIMSIAVWLVSCLLTLIPCKLSDKFFPALNGSFKLPKNSLKRHPKAWIAACVSAAIVVTGIACAYLNGLFIPNNFYARKYQVYGVDVSSYQGEIDWQTLASHDIQFAFIKATEGSSHVDSRFEENWRGASNSDLSIGAYHFFSYDSPGSSQAENFIATVPIRENSLPPVVDIEFYGDKERHLPQKEDVKRELQALLDALEAHYGKKPIIYSTEKSYLLYIAGEFDDYDIWTRNILTNPSVADWTFWQFTNRMKLEGYDGEEQFIDMNVFYGTSEEFTQYYLHN